MNNILKCENEISIPQPGDPLTLDLWPLICDLQVPPPAAGIPRQTLKQDLWSWLGLTKAEEWSEEEDEWQYFEMCHFSPQWC